MSFKYEITSEELVYGGLKLHRIRALRDFGDVRKGDLGGFIEREMNLWHTGDCWIYSDACVYGNVRIRGAMKVRHTIHPTTGSVYWAVIPVIVATPQRVLSRMARLFSRLKFRYWRVRFFLRTYFKF